MKRTADQAGLDAGGDAKKTKLSRAKLVVKNNYPELYSRAVQSSDPSERLGLFAKVNDEENVYREMFAQEREEAKELQDPHLMLVNVHDHYDMFKCVAPTEMEKALPKVFTLPDEKKKAGGEMTAVSKKEFLRNFDVFTESSLRFLDWSNVLIAGGSVLACLQPVPEPFNKNNRTRREYFHRLAYKTSDVDLFLYGLDEESANKKLDEIFEAVQESITEECIAFRSQHAITLVSKYPYRHIQIVLRLYKSPAEILMGFDVDACGIGFDGDHVWATPRAHRALTHQYNTIDMSRRSPSYEMRLAKYHQRGFEVLVPSFAPDKVDPQIFERRFDQLQGLSKLLVLEKLEIPEYRTKYKEQQRMRKLRPQAKERSTFWSQLDATFNDEWSRARLQGSANASDYSTVFLPWGPKWNAARVRKLMYTKDMILNSKWYDPKKKIHTHPCFFGSIQEIVKDCCGQCPAVPPDLVDPDAPFVSGEMKWEVVNPGAQRIGSFHPITEGDWTEGAYIFSETEELSRAVNADDLPLLIRLVKNGKISGEPVDLDGRDSVGRTLLQLAALSGADRCAEYLIEAGVRIGSRTSDGRTALHIAAQYNRENQVKLLIERARELKIENEQRKAERENAKMDEEEDEDEDMDDEDGDDEVDEEDCIRAQLERKKQEQGAGAEDEPAESEEDELDIDGREWDLGMAPIHFAAFFGSNEALKALLDAGAAVGGAKPDDSHDIPALAFAVVNSQADAARMLLAHGVNPDVRDQARNTPLHLAAQMADTQMMRLLLENGANPNSWNRSFRTPLNTLLASPHKYISTDDDGGAGQTVDDPARDPAPPHQVEALRCLLEEFDALPFYTQDALPSANEQQQFQMQFGGWGNDSDHSRLRNTLEQPLHQACALKSPRLAQIVIHHLKRFDNLHNAKRSRGTFALDSINYVNRSLSTAVDAVTSDIDNCEAGGGDWRVQRLNSEKKSLESVSVKSQFVRHLIKKRLAEIDVEIENIPFPHKVDSEEDREKLVQRLRELKKILESNGAKEFLSLKIDPKDTELKESQEQQKSGNQTGGFFGGFGFGGPFGAARKLGRKAPGGDTGPATVQLAFSSLPASIPGMYVQSSGYPDKAKPMYEKFYDAIFKNDIATVKKLASKKIGEQAHACSQVQMTVVCDGNHINAFNGSALNVAISMGSSHAKMVETLLQLSQRQFTPLNAMRKKEREHVQSINNYDLARLMNEVKPGQYLNAAGTALCAEYEGPDQNAAEMQLNCVVGPSTLIKTLSSQAFNVLHYAAQHNSVELVRTIAKFCEEHQVMSSFYDEDNTAKPVLNVLLAGVTRQAHTPFELAIALGNVAAAKELLSIGGLVEVSEEEPDEEYAGLDVGGKKMDWALEHHGRVAKKKATRTALHVAAQYNQSESAVFLLESGRSVWEQYLKSKDAYDEEDVPEWVGHFSIDGKDDKGRSALHHAAAAGNSDVLLSLLERATEGTVDMLSEDGLSALHISAWLGHMQCLSNLLTWRADPGLPDKKRGWTALSFAAMNDHDKCVRLLLRYMTAEQASQQSNKFSQTAAIVAAYYGSQKSLKVLSSDTQRKCDLSRSDVCGDNALYHAVKQRHVGCVKLLVNEVEPGKGIRENGVGMTTVDCAKASLLLQYRNAVVANGDASDVTAAREIHRVVEEKLGDGREVANTDDVRSVTYIMLQQAAADAEKDMQDGASRRSWRYKPDDTEVQGQTHGGELNMPRAAAILPA